MTYHMVRHLRIEISGGIASGKTTLCHLLSNNGFAAKFEKFSDNPFWSLFYQDPATHAFETEITFLLQHYSQIKTSIATSSTVVFDYSLFQDKAYARINLSGQRLEAFRAVYRCVIDELPSPALIVHLICTPEEELRRIQNRARSEEKSIDISYLNALNTAIENVVGEARTRIPILEIDSVALDFTHKPRIQTQIVCEILKALGRDDRRHEE
jgi:deoxyadenosine/deoxycytidine kinase